MNAPALEMKSVVKSFSGTLALNRLEFSVKPGSVIGLLGRNGAGKSTLLECALGLQNVDAGEVQFLGETPPVFSQAVRGRIGYVPQRSDLFEWMTATQMLSFFKAFYPVWNDEKVSSLMMRWSIPPNTRIARLSGGEKQRLAIIRALAHEPDTLILDEPVASLDPAGRRDFLRELIDTVARGSTVIFSTHILTDLQRVAMDVAFMKSGRILFQAELDALSESALRVSGTAQALGALQHYLVVPPVNEREDASAIARIAPAEQEKVRAAHPQIRFEPVGLEDLFIEVTQ